jgi:DNA mismatch repair protein MutS
LHRAQEVLDDFEKENGKSLRGSRKKAPVEQLSLFQQKSPLLEEIKKLDIDAMTPLEALNALYELKKKAQ